MNFFQRIKDGAGKVSGRAQNAVEIGRLNTQIATIEREMGLYHQKMGEVFYDGYRQKDMSEAEKEMLELAKTCDLLVEERDELRARIAELKNERLCSSCGRTVAEDGLYCQYCGHKLEKKQSAVGAAAREKTQPTESMISTKEKQSRPQQDWSEGKSDPWAESKQEPWADSKSDPWAAPKPEPERWVKPKLESKPKAELKPEPKLDPLPADPLDFLIPSALREEAAPSLETEPKPQLNDVEAEESEAIIRQQQLEWEQRRLEELERERRRQEEMDRRIRSWQEVANARESSANPLETAIPVVKCQVCSVELVKGTKWCPHCGSQQA